MKKRCSYNDITYIFISQVSEDVFVVSRIADESSLEESDVEDGGVEVDELEEKNFEGQVVVELRLGPVHLWKTNEKICCINVCSCLKFRNKSQLEIYYC